jgi:predicted kinase
MVVFVMGLPGSGKSFFASRLAGVIHAEYISSDRLRMEMIANRTYSVQEKERVYDEMLARMQKALKQKKSLVLDATFYKNRIREKFRREAMKVGTPVFIEVIAPESIVKERLSQPREDSEADFMIYKKIASEWEPFPEKHLILTSSRDNIKTMLQEALDYLHLSNNGKGTN